MFRLPSLPWTSFGADKVTPESVKFTKAKHHKLPSSDHSKMQKLKRKRAESSASEKSPQKPPAKKLDQHPRVVIPGPSPVQKGTNESLQVPSMSPKKAEPPTPSPTNDGDSAEEAMDDQPEGKTGNSQTLKQYPLSMNDLELIRQTCKQQISLEILMKHTELRLIDQEIAKCQIALEQLRRCKEIPYPGMCLSEKVSNGSGPALRTNTLMQPDLPPPWGVTDGPYSRHYAKWLLPDPTFDGSDTVPQLQPMHHGKYPTKGRSTRGSFNEADTGPRGGRLRGTQGSMHSLPNGYPAPRDKAGPMIQKRKSDGAMVKLVCLDCRRDNFSSAQGFINHCRIAHSRSFASHDAAADACGEPVEIDETGAVIGGEDQSTGSAGLVHPLIRSAHLLKKDASAMVIPTSSSTEPAAPPAEAAEETKGEQAMKLEQESTPAPKRKRKGKAKQPAEPPASFKASPLTPNLSNLLQKRGSTMDLMDIVGVARAPMDIHELTSEDESEEESPTPDITPGRTSMRGASMQPAQMSSPLAQPSQPPSPLKLEKDQRPQRLENINSNVHPPSAASLAASQLDGTADLMDIEPSPTNESNQAPSLVDDDEEYEGHSSSETSSSTSGSHVDLEIEVEDDESTSGAQSTRSSAEDSEFSGTAKQAAATQPRKASALRRGIAKREEKHVTFVSPSPVREVVKKRGGRRKKVT